MLLITALILGMAFAASGLIAKEINSGAGAQIANKRIHKHLTLLGNLSNLVLPIICIVLASIAQGVAGGCMAIVGLVAGSFLLGTLSLPYHIRLIMALFGLPLAVVIFLSSL